MYMAADRNMDPEYKWFYPGNFILWLLIDGIQFLNSISINSIHSFESKSF